MDRRRGHEVRVYVVSGFVLVLFVLLLGRLALIQVLHADRYEDLAAAQHRASVTLPAMRGTVRDRVGRELAASVPVPSIFANPRFLPDKPATAALLASLLGVDEAALRERLERRPEEVCVKAPLPRAEARELRRSKLLGLPGQPLRLGKTEDGELALYAHPRAVEEREEPDELAKELGPILHRDWRAVRADLEGYSHFAWIKRQVTDEECRLLRQKAREERRRRLLHLAAERERLRAERHLPEDQRRPMEPPPPLLLAGVGVMDEPRRVYAHGGVAPQLVGIVGIDGEGLEGLELVLNDALRGRPGERAFRRDSRGRYIDDLGLLRREPEPGADVELTLDAVVQSYVEEALDEAVELWAPAAAMAVVVDPQNGDVLAAGCRPSFDPNHYTDYEAETLKKLARARYVVDWMEPGSIMKPFILSGVLREGLVAEDTVVFCENGVWSLGSRRFHDHHAYGNLTVAKVIIKSSNIGAAKLGVRLGARRLYRTLRAFGFGRPTGFPLRGENPGLLRPWQQWRPGYSLPSVSIGQEVCVNMMQMTLAYAAIANGGRLMRPRVVRRIVHPDGRVEDRPPQTAGRALPADVARRVRTILCRVVEEGTGRRARLELFSVGGKTGTAQKALPGGGYSHSKVICSFVGMAPADEPRLVVMVSVDEPTKRTAGRHFGGTVAAPVVAQILRRALAYLGVPPEKPQTLARLGLAEERERTN